MTAAAIHHEGYRDITPDDTEATDPVARIQAQWRAIGRTGQAVIVAATFIAAFGMMLSSAAQAQGATCAGTTVAASEVSDLTPPMI